MGFTRGVAFTDDQDLVDAAVYEPNLARLFVDTDETKTSWSTQHISANDDIMDKLLARAYDPSKVSNTNSFKKYAIYFILWHIYTGWIQEIGDEAHTKSALYKGMYEEGMATQLVILTEEDTDTGDLPVVENIDASSKMDFWSLREGDRYNG